MGYGLQSVLEGLQGGVLSSILQGFSTQFSILAPLFTGQSVTPDFFNNETEATPTPDGTTEYQTDSTSGTVAQVNPPRPNYTPVSTGTTTKASESGRGRFAARNRSGTTASSSTGNSSGLRVQIFNADVGEAYIVDSEGQIVRGANDTEIATGVVQT